MKIIRFTLALLILAACAKTPRKQHSIQLITAVAQQDSIFQNLTVVTDKLVPAASRQDSLAFLILPVQASCPSCRKKTIDSIVSHQEDLRENHFIIIAASGGRKTINGYFRDQDKELPDIGNKLLLDSINQSYKLDLCNDRPTIYYAYGGKVYKKVSAIPATVREDLREFFSGYRNDQ
jgi:hypothetical protein